MRVIDTARLAFREGSSDKVYEVDLVEVAANQYVVNFRFGRRGTALRDGTKTPAPVKLDKARSIFDKLVAEKTAGGYRAGGVVAPAATDDFDLIAALEQRPEGPMLWKVADRDLKDAETVVLALFDREPPAGLDRDAWRYLVVSALARCGTAAALPTLTAIVDDPRTQQHLRDAARIAVVRIEPARAASLSRFAFTPAILAAYDKRDASGVAAALQAAMAADAKKALAAAVGLYLLDDAVARPAVLAAVRVSEASDATLLRTLFRLAELRRDGELYVRVARRIDRFTSTTPPFGPHTRNYLRRRTARVLRRLGRAGSADYVRMAAAWLVDYTDADGDAARRGSHGSWYAEFARHHTLNDIIYANSTRYEVGPHVRSVWRCVGRHRPDGPGPTAREEAFPSLWDRSPDVLWTVLRGGRAKPVAEFAVRALRDHRGFVDGLADDAVAEVLSDGHELAQRFALEVAERRPMTAALARGGLASSLPEAHAWVLRWIAAHPEDVVRDPDMLALLVTGHTAEIREVGLGLLRGRVIAEPLAQSVAARALAILLGLPDTPAAAARAAGSVGVLLRVLDTPLRSIGADVLRDLIAHPLAALGELAGELILRHAHREQLPHSLLEALLGSPHASVRALGGRLVAMTPADIAADDLDALELFATSGNRELREGTRTLIGEVARRAPDVGRRLAARLVDALLRTQPEGAPAHILSLLRSELADCLPAVPVATILRLVGALSPHAREVGGILLPQLGPDDVGLDDIARLANSEILSIRHGAWALARAAVPRYQVAPVAFAKLVDAQWDDTRAFAIELIREQPKLPADAIIAICDSIRPEVQALGKQLLHEQFTDADAGRYLVRLAEHPSAGIQLLVSGLLEHHVKDVAQLRAVLPYLAGVMSLVNRGGVAKLRVLALLRTWATRSPEAAHVLAPLLDRQSATIAVSHKAPLIATMVDVHTAYPEVPLPITVKPPERAS